MKPATNPFISLAPPPAPVPPPHPLAQLIAQLRVEGALRSSGSDALARELATWRPAVRKDPPAGFIREPIAAYHRRLALGRSQLEKLSRSPRHFLRTLQGESPTDSAALLQGQALHKALLEPETFWREFYVGAAEKPKEPERPEHLKDVNRRSKEGKRLLDEWEATWRERYDAELARFEAENASRRSIGEQIAADTAEMVQNFRRSKALTKILDGAVVEGTVLFKQGRTGIPCRARPDIVSADGTTIYDVKTSRDATPRSFDRDLENLGYLRQAAWYMEGVFQATGVHPERFVLLVCEKGSNEWSEVELHADEIAAGQGDMFLLVRELEEHLLTKPHAEWAGYGRRVGARPDWMRR